MKKIAFLFAVATLFVACGGNTNKPADQAPVDTVAQVAAADTAAVVDTTAVDTTAVDTTAQAQ